MSDSGKLMRPNSKSWSFWVVSLIWLSLLVAALIELDQRDYQSFLIAVITMVVIWLPKALPSKFNIHLPQSFITAIVFFLYATLFLGEFGDFYNRFWWWDVVLHSLSAVGFGLVGIVIILIINRRQRVVASPIILASFAFSFAMSIGAIWEIIEFILDQALGWNMQKSGLVDTMWDLIIDMFGALIAATIGFWYLKMNKQSGIAKQITEAVKANS